MKSPIALVDLTFRNIDDENDTFEARVPSYVVPTFPNYIFNQELEEKFTKWAEGKIVKREIKELEYPL